MMKNLYHHTYLAGLLLAFFALFVTLPQSAVAQNQNCIEIDQGECLDTGASKSVVHRTLKPQAFGDFTGSFGVPVAGTSVGLENDGSGDLLTTEIGADQFYTQTTAGALVNGPTAAAASVNPIGITTDGTNLYITDTTDDDVDVYLLDGTFVTSFSVAAQTTFPEGITYNPETGNLYVVDGSGGNDVEEYMTDGTFVASFPINGSSQDGIAYDPNTCGYWIYDSGTDLVRQYDSAFTEVASFPGTAANGLGTGEGLGVVGTTVFVMATGSGAVGMFDVAGAFSECIDLSVNKTVNDTSPQVGDDIEFTITVTATDGDATNVEVLDMLPAPLSLVSSSATQGSFAAGVWTIGNLLAGQTATLTITANVADTWPVPITNTAEVFFDQQPDGDPSNDSASVTLFIQGADLSLDKDVSTFTPDLGDTFDYDITVCHNGGIPAVGIRVTDKLPRGVTFVSSSGDYDLASGIYQFGDLEDGDCTTESITVRLNTTEEVTNRADISFSSAPDPDESDNADQVSVNGQAADLELEVHLVSFSQAGGTSFATFEGTVTNQGPSTVNAAAITIMVSPGATITGFSVPAGSFPFFGSTLTLVLIDPLPAGQSITASVTVEAPANTPIIVAAEITDSDREDPDSTPGDGTGDDFDAGFAGVRDNPDFVRGLGPGGIIARGGQRFAADLSLAKTVDNASPAAGTDVVYTITVLNDGPQATTGVAVTDLLPGGLTFVSSTASQGSYDAATGVWDVGFVFVGGTATLEITATVTGSGTITNTATITGSNLPDPDDFFNFFDESPEQDDTDSASLTVQSASAKAGVVEGVKLGLGYPNPFNPEAVIPFALGESSQVRLAVYDMLGRQVAMLVEGQVSAGSHEVLFSGASLPTGVYLVRLEAQGQVQTQRITLMK